MLGDVAMTIPAPALDFHSPVVVRRRLTVEMRHMVQTLADGDPAEKARMIIDWLRTSPRDLRLAVERANRRVAAIALRQANAPLVRARHAQAHCERRANQTPAERAAALARSAAARRARRAAARAA